MWIARLDFTCRPRSQKCITVPRELALRPTHNHTPSATFAPISLRCVDPDRRVLFHSPERVRVSIPEALRNLFPGVVERGRALVVLRHRHGKFGLARGGCCCCCCFRNWFFSLCQVFNPSLRASFFFCSEVFTFRFDVSRLTDWRGLAYCRGTLPRTQLHCCKRQKRHSKAEGKCRLRMGLFCGLCFGTYLPLRMAGFNYNHFGDKAATILGAIFGVLRGESKKKTDKLLSQ